MEDGALVTLCLSEQPAQLRTFDPMLLFGLTPGIKLFLEHLHMVGEILPAAALIL